MYSLPKISHAASMKYGCPIIPDLENLPELFQKKDCMMKRYRYISLHAQNTNPNRSLFMESLSVQALQQSWPQ